MPSGPGPGFIARCCILYEGGWNTTEIARLESVKRRLITDTVKRFAANKERWLKAPYGTSQSDRFLGQIEARIEQVANLGVEDVTWQGGFKGSQPQDNGDEFKILHYLYVEERLTCLDIAQRMKVCPSTVRRKLMRLGIARRPRREQTVRFADRSVYVKRSLASARKQGYYVLSPEEEQEAIRLYVEERLDTLQVAKRLGHPGSDTAARNRIRRVLMRNDIPRRNQREIAVLLNRKPPPHPKRIQLLEREAA